MNTEHLEREKVIEQYRMAVEPLFRYLPWLTSNAGKKVSHNYAGEGSESFTFPVYDGTLMSFVKEAAASPFMDRNYVYTFTRNKLYTTADVLSFIEQATRKELDALAGILSKYVLEGMRKGAVWTEAVEEEIYLKVLLKMKEILEFWDGPLA